MLIVAGHITVAETERESYLAGCAVIVEAARKAPGCLDISIAPDLLDAARINIYERWESRAELETFRGSGPPDEQGAARLSVSVAEYDVTGGRGLFE